MSAKTDALTAAVAAVSTEVANLKAQIADLTTKEGQVIEDEAAMDAATTALNTLVTPQ